MELNTVYKEPCLETLRRMPDNFIDCMITSPPYWQLRDYGYDGQWGLEPNFEMYLENLWSMMTETFRVLKPSGSVWVNLGDTYNGNKSGNTNGSQKGVRQIPGINSMRLKKEKNNDIRNKCLLLIPHRFAIGCIDRGWVLRNDIVWAKSNNMPDPSNDRLSKKHEYMFLMTKSETGYYFDVDAIKDKIYNKGKKRAFAKKGNKDRNDTGNVYDPSKHDFKNPGDVTDFWDIPTKGSSEEHFAQYNDELIKRPILAGCPEGGLIYDPFMGSGTTGLVALRANRQFIGSEMSDEYHTIATKRLDIALSQTKLF